MARKGAGSPAGSRDGDGISYRASLSLLAFLVACLTALVLVALEFSSLDPLLHEVTAGTQAPSATQIEQAAPLIVVPLLAALYAYLVGRWLIRLIRIQTYRRHLHGYLKQWLRTYAPFAVRGIAPPLVTATSLDAPSSGRLVELADLVRKRQLVLLTGSAGSGKTVALHALAYELTRKRRLLRLWLGHAPLPVLLSVEPTVSAEYSDDESMYDQVRRSLRHFGTRGLAANTSTLLKRGRLLLLGDGLADLPSTQRAHTLRDYALIADKGQHLPVVVADTADNTAVAEQAARAGWNPVYMLPLRAAQVRRITHDARLQESSDAVDAADLLAPTLALPAALAAFAAIGYAPSELPSGRAALFRACIEHALSTGSGSGDAPQLALKLAGAIAVGLRASGQHGVRTTSGGSLGRILAEWLEHVEIWTPTETLAGDSPIFSPEELETTCRRALRSGVLAQDPEKRQLRFAHRILEATCAAAWLEATDTGLGRLRPEVLQPEWILPVLLWAGAAEHAGDITFRLLRLLDTPESASVRAGFASPDDYQAAVLALALGTACESLAPLLARSTPTQPPTAALSPRSSTAEQHFTLAEEQLRDLLDRVFRYIENPEQQDAMRAALTTLTEAGGPEVLSYLRFLATYPRLQRLLRAQLIVVLGLVTSDAAVATVVSLLDDPDTLTRQAVERALQAAGARALPALREALSHPSPRVRTRAAEALTQLGDSAVETALVGLTGQQPEQRAAAAHTLGTLKAARGEEALSERLLHDSDGAVRVAAALALGQIATEAAVQALERASSSEAAPIRTAVAQALGIAHAPSALNTLVHLLADPEPRVRASAAAALGVLGDERAVPALQEHRDDQDPWTQNAVVLSLRRLGS